MITDLDLPGLWMRAVTAFLLLPLACGSDFASRNAAVDVDVDVVIIGAGWS